MSARANMKVEEGITIRRTDSRHFASWMAKEQDVVVLPEPDDYYRTSMKQ